MPQNQLLLMRDVPVLVKDFVTALVSLDALGVLELLINSLQLLGREVRGLLKALALVVLRGPQDLYLVVLENVVGVMAVVQTVLGAPDVEDVLDVTDAEVVIVHVVQGVVLLVQDVWGVVDVALELLEYLVAQDVALDAQEDVKGVMLVVLAALGVRALATDALQDVINLVLEAVMETVIQDVMENVKQIAMAHVIQDVMNLVLVLAVEDAQQPAIKNVLPTASADVVPSVQLLVRAIVAVTALERQAILLNNKTNLLDKIGSFFL